VSLFCKFHPALRFHSGEQIVDNTQNRKNMRRTVIILTVIALAVYGGFILMGVLRA